MIKKILNSFKRKKQLTISESVKNTIWGEPSKKCFSKIYHLSEVKVLSECYKNILYCSSDVNIIMHKLRNDFDYIQKIKK